MAPRIRTLRINYNVFDMNATIETNPLLDRLPKHLKQFIKPQDYSDYTPIKSSVALCDAQNVNYLRKWHTILSMV
jgi:phenylalanine-4-hydroxylase